MSNQRWKKPGIANAAVNNIISAKEGTHVIIVIWQERREEFSLIHILCHDSSALHTRYSATSLLSVLLLTLPTSTILECLVRGEGLLEQFDQKKNRR
jgi:hypothetical protein